MERVHNNTDRAQAGTTDAASGGASTAETDCPQTEDAKDKTVSYCTTVRFPLTLLYCL